LPAAGVKHAHLHGIHRGSLPLGRSVGVCVPRFRVTLPFLGQGLCIAPPVHAAEPHTEPDQAVRPGRGLGKVSGQAHGHAHLGQGAGIWQLAHVVHVLGSGGFGPIVGCPGLHHVDYVIHVQVMPARRPLRVIPRRVRPQEEIRGRGCGYGRGSEGGSWG